MEQFQNTIIVKIDAGIVDRHNDLVRFSFNPVKYFSDWQEGVSKLAVSQVTSSGQPLLNEIPSQFEPNTRELSWQMADLSAGQSSWYRIQAKPQPPVDPLPIPRFAIHDRTSHLLITADDQVFTRYNFLGVWKPYFWPLNGNHGSVVRGAGGEDHPHHTGLYLAYGGHGEGGSANIWSDWDEPPYGPCGKTLHRQFTRLTQGLVYAEFVEDLIHIKGNGDLIMNETRTVRAWYTDLEKRFLEIIHRTSYPVDIGDRQFLLVARMSPSMKLADQGHVENSEGHIGRSKVHHQRARWCDLAGEVGDGINGLALFDHPSNPEHPGFWGEIAVPQQMSILHHPPYELENETFQLRFGAYVHQGTTQEADVKDYYQRYINPVEVEIVDC